MAKYNAVNYNVIYVYSIDDEDHRGYLKVGKTSFYSRNSISQLSPNCNEVNQAAHECIYSQTHRATVKYTLLYADIALMPIKMNDGTVQQQAFDDFLVRNVIFTSIKGVPVKKFEETGRLSEWIGCGLDTIITAITAIKSGKNYIPDASSDFVPTPVERTIKLRKEQLENVEKTISVFKKGDTMLWDCKMRYGKNVTAYEMIRRMNEKGLFFKAIVITHRPAVEDGWGEDHRLMFAGTNHRFIDKTNGRDVYNGALDAENDRKLLRVVESGDPFIYFASIQDLRGSVRVGGKYNKNNAVFDLDWDLLIVDEAHEGTRTELGDAVISAIRKKCTKVLSLTGTPYNIIGDYEDANKYTWSYVDEQRAKATWEEEHPGEKNPYEELPTMNIFTFDITDQLPESYRYVTEDSAFNFREFFRTWTGDKERDYRDIPSGKKIGDFVHEDAVSCFLSLISKEDASSNYPFATEDFRDMFRHTFWLVPGVAAAHALGSMLRKHPGFQGYHVVDIAGDGDEERPYDEALGMVKSAIRSYPRTICISCGRLTTGVTVREWTGIMMLSGSASTSASGYMQTIFRVQSPGCIDGRQKTNCYVFDFAPDRTLKVIAEVHQLRHKRGQTDDEKAKQALGEFINFCPVISIEGTSMRAYDVPEMMRQIKRISVEAAINNGFDDDTIYKSDAGLVLDTFDEEILKKLSNVVNPKSKGQKKTDIEINRTGMTNEERKTAERAAKKRKKDLTQEEKDALEKLRQQREEQKKMFNLLRAVSIRLPLLFYGADADITEVIHLKDFVNLIDDESWAEFMPTGLRKELFLDILRYYDEDVVVGAGLRIRKLAKAADELPPTLRAKRIVEILSRFKNPDKETVLTPWRVVNMHLGDMLGGYNFYDDLYKKELDVPRLIEQGDVTANILLNPNAKILEVNSKSGLYPLYMAYSIYMMYVDGDERKLPLEKAQSLWFRTLSRNIYVLCKTKMARTITIRTLAGYSGKSVNAIYLPKLIEERLRDIPRLANKLRNPATWKKEGDEKMKYSALVGNPPYQIMDSDEGRGASSVFPLFVDCAKALSPHYVSLIIPARWYAGGKGLDDFRADMLNDKHLVSLVDIENSKECFPTADIAGGLCYFLWDSETQAEQCEVVNYARGERTIARRSLNEYPIFIRSNNSISILKKVLAKTNSFADDLVLTQKPFGFRTYERGSNAPSADSVTLIHSDGIGYVPRGSIAKNADLIDSYKIIVGRFVPSNGEIDVKPGEGYRATTTPKLLCPGEVCTETYIVIATFSSLEQAQNYLAYFKGKLARFLLRLSISSVNISKEIFQFVPMLDFSRQWTDEELYQNFELTDEEVALIETTMRAME